MKYLIDTNGNYYEAEKNITGATEVSRRPSVNHVLQNGVWVFVAPPPPPIPTVVTMRQARLAMLDAGILTSVSDALAAMTGPTGEAARIEWEYAAELKRDHPLVASLSAALGLSSAQLDGLFTVAAGL